jgi:hypothetical protein
VLCALSCSFGYASVRKCTAKNAGLRFAPLESRRQGPGLVENGVFAVNMNGRVGGAFMFSDPSAPSPVWALQNRGYPLTACKQVREWELFKAKVPISFSPQVR